MRSYSVIFLWIVFYTSQTTHAGGPAYTRINAAAESAETAFTNPAGMTRFDIKSTTAGFIFANGFSEFEVDESKTTTSGGDPDDGGPLVIPYYYSTRPLGINGDWE